MSRKRDDDDENQENLMILRLPEKYAQASPDTTYRLEVPFYFYQ